MIEALEKKKILKIKLKIEETKKEDKNEQIKKEEIKKEDNIEKDQKEEIVIHKNVKCDICINVLFAIIMIFMKNAKKNTEKNIIIHY